MTAEDEKFTVLRLGPHPAILGRAHDLPGTRGEPGWMGRFSREHAAGAIPNGTKVEKISSKERDAHQDGAPATVLGSIFLPHLGRFAYFVEWDDMPRCACLVIEGRIKEKKMPHFGRFVKAEAREQTIALVEVVLIGEPGSPVPTLTFNNLTTGAFALFSPNDEVFGPTGRWERARWELTTSQMVPLVGDGHEDELAIAEGPVQLGLWRETDAVGLFERFERIAPGTPDAA